MVLLAFGVVVISLVDNLIRAMLVGKETKIPDYIVLYPLLAELQYLV